MNRRRFFGVASVATGSVVALVLAKGKPHPPHPHPSPTSAPTPSPAPTPAGSRPVQPGEDIGALLVSYDDLTLLAGIHRYFSVPADGRNRWVRWSSGAEVQGGVLVPAGARAALLSPVVTSAVFAITVRGFATIDSPDVYGNSEGIRWDGAQAQGTVVGGFVHDNTKVVRNTESPVGDDYSAEGMEFHNTTGPILIDGVSIYNQRVSGPRPTFSWDDNGAGLGVLVRPQTQSWDYGLNDGSAFEFWQGAGVEIRNCSLWNNTVAVETGTHGPDCTLYFHHNLVRNLNADPLQLAKGLLLRTALNSVVEHNTFINLDHWAMAIEGGGSFGATVDGLRVRSNLAVTPSALFETNGQATGTWTHDYNGVAGSKAWGAFGADANGVAASDPLFDANFGLQPASPFIGKAHDGGNIGWR